MDRGWWLIGWALMALSVACGAFLLWSFITWGDWFFLLGFAGAALLIVSIGVVMAEVYMHPEEYR
jgi:hypothetical protein